MKKLIIAATLITSIAAPFAMADSIMCHAKLITSTDQTTIELEKVTKDGQNLIQSTDAQKKFKITVFPYGNSAGFGVYITDNKTGAMTSGDVGLNSSENNYGNAGVALTQGKGSKQVSVTVECRKGI